MFGDGCGKKFTNYNFGNGNNLIMASSTYINGEINDKHTKLLMTKLVDFLLLKYLKLNQDG